jgi:hypothetical protein
LFDLQGSDGAVSFAAAADVTGRVGVQGVMADGHAEHEPEDEFRATGFAGLVFVELFEEAIESADGRLTYPQVAQGWQDGGADAGGVSVDCLGCDAGFLPYLLEP